MVAKPWFKSFEWEAGMTLGNIQMHGAIGIDLITPSRIYFLAKCSGLTMGNIIDIFMTGLNLPSYIADTGFEGPAALSFSIVPGAKTLSGDEIPFGIRARFKCSVQFHML